MAEKNTSIMTIETTMKRDRKEILQWRRYLQLAGLLTSLLIFMVILLGLFFIGKYSFFEIRLWSDDFEWPKTLEYSVGEGIWFINVTLMIFIGLIYAYVALLIQYKIKTLLTGYRGISLRFEPDLDGDEKIIIVSRIYNYEEFLLVWDMISANIFRIDLQGQSFDESDFELKQIECEGFIPGVMSFPILTMKVSEDPHYPHLFRCSKIEHFANLLTVADSPSTEEETRFLWNSAAKDGKEVS